MKHPQKKVKSVVAFNTVGFLKEMQTWRALARNEWPLLLLLALGIMALINYTRPLPPREVSMAVGQAGSAHMMIANYYAQFFADRGVELKIVRTDGTGQNLMAIAEHPDIKAGLVVGGAIKKGQYPQLMSLGSIEYEPLWLFYRGAVYDQDDVFQHFSTQRIAIGTGGTATQRILREILELRGIPIETQSNFLVWPHQQAANALINGEIDAMALVDGFESPTIQRLLNTPDIHLYSFKLAPAYIKKIPYLDSVVVPRGSLNVAEVRPPEDVRMVASSLTVVVDKDLHPALQLLFLMAADQFGDSRTQFFARPDEFPSYKDQSLPLSPIAKTYFDEGPPKALRFAPFWMASFVDRMWLLLVGLLAVGYPLYRLLPNYRHMQSRVELAGNYEELRNIERSARAARTVRDIDIALTALRQLEQDMDNIAVPEENMREYYGYWTAINHVLRLINERRAQLLAAGKTPDDTQRPDSADH